jgi:hypothetical protein
VASGRTDHAIREAKSRKSRCLFRSGRWAQRDVTCVRQADHRNVHTSETPTQLGGNSAPYATFGTSVRFYPTCDDRWHFIVASLDLGLTEIGRVAVAKHDAADHGRDLGTGGGAQTTQHFPVVDGERLCRTRLRESLQKGVD